MSEYQCFVMMPFGDDLYDRIFAKIKSAAEMIDDQRINVERADIGEPLDISQLEDHITKHIDRSNFAIAEISDQNPNVLLEVGLAMGRDKPVILMVKKGSGVPADLQGRYWFEYDETNLERIPRRLSGFIRSALNETLALRAKTKYPVIAYNNRDNAPILKSLAVAKEKILINTTNLHWVITIGAVDILVERLKEIPTLQVRILTLEPESEFTADRSRQLGLLVRDFRRQLRDSLDQLKTKLSEFDERCKIATYSEFPTQITFIIDDTVYCGVVTANRRARDNVVIELPLIHMGVSPSFMGHLRAVWERAELLGGGRPGPLL